MGIGVRKDESVAMQWFASAARMGIVPAQVDYAIRLYNGTGVVKDEAAATAWFERAAEAGDPIAQNRLARILAVGAGAPPDPVEAAKWHFLAMAAGKQDEWLDTFVTGLSDSQRVAAAEAARLWPGIN
jgi:TPR repeat protein